jgi:hypothetical protein
VLDTLTGKIQFWKLSGDPDHATPALLEGDEALRVRREVFGPYEQQESIRASQAASSPAAPEVALDARLRSWGYE